MRIQDRLVRTIEMIFMGAVLVWVFAAATALLQPAVVSAPHGVVEIYSLTAVPSSAAI